MRTINTMFFFLVFIPAVLVSGENNQSPALELIAASAHSSEISSQLMGILAHFKQVAVKEQTMQFLESQTPRTKQNLNEVTEKIFDSTVSSESSLQAFSENWHSGMQAHLRTQHQQTIATLTKQHQKQIKKMWKEERHNRIGWCVSACRAFTMFALAFGGTALMISSPC